MAQHYTIKQRGSQYGGIDVYACNYCRFNTHLSFRFDLHLQAFHPEKLNEATNEPEEVIESLSDLTRAELVELAKNAGVAIRGSKEEIIARLNAEPQEADDELQL